MIGVKKFITMKDLSDGKRYKIEMGNIGLLNYSVVITSKKLGKWEKITPYI